MKAVTLHQPYASLVALEVKTIETRTWPTPKSLVGQRIAIHAAKKPVRSVYDYGDGTYSAKTPPPGFEHTQDHCWEWIENVNYGGGEGRWYWTAPLGAVVATARLAACIPIIDGHSKHCSYEAPEHVCVGHAAGSALHHLPINGQHDVTEFDVTDQLPFGNFEPGNWGWMLEDIEALAAPIPCKGYQRVWNLPDDAVDQIIESEERP